MKDIFLVIPVFLPLLFGGFLVLCKRFDKLDCRKITGYVTLLNSLMIWGILLGGIGRKGLMLFRITDRLNIFFRLDGPGMVFAGLISFLWPLAVLYASEYMEEDKHQRSFFGFYTMTYGATAAIAMAGNITTLYVFYEMMTLVTFPLVLHYKNQESREASIVYLVYSFGGATCAFIGMIVMIVTEGSGIFRYGGFLQHVGLNADQIHFLLIIYVVSFFGFGVKAALFPLHGWLPKVSVAPTPVTALLHAVAVVKAGAFAILRLTYYCYGPEMLRGTFAQKVTAFFVMATIFYGSSMAVKEIHFKRRLAYSTISNLSYILLGAVMMCPAGLMAALTHMVFHALMKITAFFCAGAVMKKADKHYIYELDGLGYRMPVTFVCFTIAALSLTGTPLFCGFISKWFIARGALAGGGRLGIIAIGVMMVSALLTAIYMMTVVVRAFYPGKDFDPENISGISDPTWRMLLPITLISSLIIFFGIYSGPLIRFFEQIAKGVI